MDPILKARLIEYFGEGDFRRIDMIFGELCEKGQEYLTKLLEEVVEGQKSPGDFLGELRDQWEKVWCIQSEEVRGDPELDTDEGVDSRQAFWKMYFVLRLPMPQLFAA